MPVPFDNAALSASGSCGCHQQALAAPVASGDFTNIGTANAADGVYTLNGETVTIGDIIDLASPDTQFDPENLDENGFKPNADGIGGSIAAGLEIKEPLLSSLLTNGFTVLMEGFVEDAATSPDGLSGGFALDAHDPDWNFDAYATVNCGVVTTLTPLNYAQDRIDDDVNLIPSGQISKVAFTVTADRMAFSINGGTAIATVSGAIDETITRLNISVAGGVNTRLRSFAFYEVVDDADLPAMSALS